MKQLALILITVFLFSCNSNKENTKDYVQFSGTIQNKSSDSLFVLSPDYRTLIKSIPLAADGSFSDTLKLEEPGVYNFKLGDEYSTLFLKNGYELDLSMDVNEFDESIVYEGIGADDNNYLVERALLKEKLFDLDYEGLDSLGFSKKLTSIEEKLNALAASKSNLDSITLKHSEEDTKSTIKGYGRYVFEMITIRENLPEGSPSPTFENYENFAGGTTSLKDLAGKYVYIDVWATWCAPCKAEIPFLKEIEHDFQDENIHFVSISIDEEKNHDKWLNMVENKELGGIQLFADNDWQSKFIKDYYISGIPRFILIDPSGNIVTPDAPRPSNPRLRELLEEVL